RFLFMTESLLNALTKDLGNDLMAFGPELVLCAGIVLLLIMRMILPAKKAGVATMALVFTLLAFSMSVQQWLHLSGYDPRVGAGTVPLRPTQELFSGMLVFDNLTIFLKLFLLFFLGSVIVLSMLTKIPEREDSAD